MSFNPDQGNFINKENLPNLYGKLGGDKQLFQFKNTLRDPWKIISSREKVKEPSKVQFFLIQLAINQLTVKMHYLIPIRLLSSNNTSRLVVADSEVLINFTSNSLFFKLDSCQFVLINTITI